ncbi:MAG: inorganic diphosphatase, partial [Betaproteobacteria bacterium]
KSPRDLPELTTRQIAHFFEHYKDLEPGKWVRVASWVEAEAAKREIEAGVVRYNKLVKRKSAAATTQPTKTGKPTRPRQP